MEKSELFSHCDQVVSREELLKKMKGVPDFVPEEYYCKGMGQYCLEEDLCVQLVARAHFPTRLPCMGFTMGGKTRSIPP